MFVSFESHAYGHLNSWSEPYHLQQQNLTKMPTMWFQMRHIHAYKIKSTQTAYKTKQNADNYLHCGELDKIIAYIWKRIFLKGKEYW